MHQFDTTIGTVVNITTPGYPNFYQDDTDCTWVFKSESLENRSFQITFHEFLTFNAHDALVLKSGNETHRRFIASFDSFIKPGAKLVVNEDEISLHFKTSRFFRHVGFFITVEDFPEPGKAGNLYSFSSLPTLH